MRYRGIHAARMFSGLWSFLFKLPSVDIEFPFLGTTRVYTAYQGINIQEEGIGGIFATNLILWPCFLMYRYRSKLREKQGLLFAVISVVSGMVIACADVQMSGVLTRYMADFAIFFYLASFMVIFAFIDGRYKKRSGSPGGYSEEGWCKGIAGLCCITILYCFMTVLSLYVTGDYDDYQTVWYYHLKEIFDVFGV
ncbi:MAG: hypothetical protein NC312_10225 [Bacteroides fragilis]|nr:hypothetical protein [Bacteroides fragilis]